MKQWSDMKESEKNAVKSLIFAIPIMWFLWFYLKLYILFGVKSFEWRLGIYVFLVIIATGMWTNMFNKASAMKKLADRK